MFTATAVHGPGPRATPLFVGGKLFTLGVSGIVSALDAESGRLLWQIPSPSEQPFYGTASSPAADANLLFVHTGNYDALTAFDRDTGAVAWRTAGTFTYSSPLIVELDGVRQVVSVTQDRGARQPGRFRADRALYRRRQCHLGSTGRLGQPVLRQGCGHADPVDYHVTRS